MTIGRSVRPRCIGIHRKVWWLVWKIRMARKIVPGMQEEYKKRHDNIWPEMKEVLANAGIVNYSIWMQGEELFGYYECEKGVEYAAKVQAESDVVKMG